MFKRNRTFATTSRVLCTLNTPKNVSVAEALPRTPLGELIALPRSPAGPLCRKGKGVKMGTEDRKDRQTVENTPMALYINTKIL